MPDSLFFGPCGARIQQTNNTMSSDIKFTCFIEMLKSLSRYACAVENIFLNIKSSKRIVMVIWHKTNKNKTSAEDNARFWACRTGKFPIVSYHLQLYLAALYNVILFLYDSESCFYFVSVILTMSCYVSLSSGIFGNIRSFYITADYFVTCSTIV